MTGKPIEKVASQAPGVAGVRWPKNEAPPLVYSVGIGSESASDDLRVHVRSLQWLVCDLPSKNQRLRMALIEANIIEGSIGSLDELRDASRWGEDL